MIEEVLLQYGVLGVFVIILISYNQRLMKKTDLREEALAQVVKNNTEVMGQVKQAISLCPSNPLR